MVFLFGRVPAWTCSFRQAFLAMKKQDMEARMKENMARGREVQGRLQQIQAELRSRQSDPNFGISHFAVARSLSLTGPILRRHS
jgi:hypothetical protein